ncbi:MAG: tyrosine-type recombinase/integrase [Acidobacteriota bacterium]
MNPIARLKKLKEYREERPRLKQKDFLKVLKHLPFPVKQMVLFIYETGCRPSEAMGLKREYVDLEKQTAIFNMRKGGDNALVAIFNMRKGGDNALVALTSRAVSAIQQVMTCPHERVHLLS